MKKLIFAVMAVTFMAAPMANAQKVNKDAILSKLAKCDADVADAKKGRKPPRGSIAARLTTRLRPQPRKISFRIWR